MVQSIRYQGGGYKAKAYACDISEEVVEKIMLIDDVDDMWKLLLMMGIGCSPASMVWHPFADGGRFLKELWPTAQKIAAWMRSPSP